MAPRGTGPTSIKWVPIGDSQVPSDPQNTWLTLVSPGVFDTYPKPQDGSIVLNRPALFNYQVLTDIGAPGQPDYENQTVLETFDNYTSGGLFTIGDLKPEYANLGLSADKLAAVIFPANANEGTFVIDNFDRIYDHHYGFAGQNTFTPEALARGIGFDCLQHYKAGSVALGSYTLAQTLKKSTTFGFVYQVKKNGP